jgi:hypothetical protein
VQNLYDLPDDVQPVAVRAVGLREQNVKLYEELEKLGGGAEIGPARIEHVLVFLVDAGVITELQRWEEAALWEEALREQLKMAIEQLGLIRAKEKEEQEAIRRRRLLLP